MNDKIQNLKDSFNLLLEDYERISNENKEMMEIFSKISDFMRHPKEREIHSWIEKERNSSYVLYFDRNDPTIEYREYSNGSKYWYKNGKLHRDGDEPAAIWPGGTKEWWKNRKRHRDGDEPAVIRSNGTKLWYKNGLPHRDGNKSAAILPDGREEWFKNGKFIK